MGPEVVSSPSFKESADKFAAYVVDALPKVGDLIIEEAPRVIQDVIVLDLYRALLVAGCWFLAGLVMLIPGICLIRVKDDSEGMCKFVGCLIATAASVVLLAGVGYNLYNAIGPAFAPRAHILQRVGILK